MSVKRIADIRKKVRRDNLDGLVVTHMNYIRYLTGFTGSAGLLVITGNEAHFLTDFRYKDQAARQVIGARVAIVKGDPVACLKDFPRLNRKHRTFGFDEETTTVGAQRRLKGVLSQSILVPAAALFADLGWVKDRSELASIKKAVEISDLAFERIVNIIAPGIRERELAAELEYQMMMLGSEKPAFDSIVASGVNSAMPHAGVSAKKVKKGEFITFDFGATVNGYVSDITRTVVVGKASQRQKKVYGIVLKAQKAAIRKVKAGVMGSAVDMAARNIITRAGYGKEFGHGTGHGIGFFVHVGPRVSSVSQDKLMVNNVITIEPGIYISGWGGVRIEDDVVVTRKGCDVLNRAPKNLLEL
jgi:Xaa-Pro aminopeptidase